MLEGSRAPAQAFFVGNVLDNDTDANDGDVLRVGTVVGVPAPISGNVQPNGSNGGRFFVSNDGSVFFRFDSPDDADALDDFDDLAEGETRVTSTTYQAADLLGALSATRTISIVVTGTNDAPVVSGGTAVTFTEGDAATTINSRLLVSDVDNTSLTGATVRFTSGFVAGEDFLRFSTVEDITGDYDADTGVLSLTGPATITDYQAVLRSVQYENNSDTPNTTEREISFIVNDGALDSIAAISTITVKAVNDAPELAVDPLTATTDDNAGIFTADLSTNVSDAEDDSLSFTPFTEFTRTIFSEDFEDEVADSGLEPGGAAENFTSFDQFFVLQGTVDLLDSNGANLEAQVDLDGSQSPGVSSPAGSIQTINEFTLLPGLAYELSYELEGNGLSGITETETVRVVIGEVTVDGVQPTVVDVTTTIDSDGAEQVVTVPFTVDSVTSVGMVFMQLGANDRLGAYLSDIVITETIAASLDSAGNLSVDTSQFDPFSFDDSVTLTLPYTVTDGTDPVTGQLDLTIIGANDAPVATANSRFDFTENDPATAIAPELTVSDVDSPFLSSAQVAITSGFSAGEDFLDFVAQGDIVGNYDAELGILTLSGTGTLAEYEAVLQSVQYRNESDAPSTAIRQVFFTVNDGNTDSKPSGSVITVIAENDAPIATTPAPAAAIFDGTQTKFAALSRVTDFPTNEVTIGTFVRFDDKAGNETLVSFAQQSGVVPGGETLRLFMNDEFLSLTVGRGANTETVQFDASGLIRDGEFHHVAVTYDVDDGTDLGNGRVNFFVDGVRLNPTDLLIDGGGLALQGTLVLGHQQTGNTGTLVPDSHANSFTGAIANTNIWEDIRTPEEIADAATGQISFSDGNLFTALRYDEGTRGFFDLSLNGRVVTNDPRGFEAEVGPDQVAAAFSVGGAQVTFNDVSITDADAGNELLAVDLAVSSGILGLLGETDSLIFTDSDGSDGSLAFRGTQDDINGVFASGLSYRPGETFTGLDTLRLVVDDVGNTGDGGPLTDFEVFGIETAQPVFIPPGGFF